MTFETIKASIGGEFSVRLKATPSTGYVWDIEQLPESVQFLGSDYEKPASDLKPGDAMIKAFRFRVLEEGEHMISFVLKRQWERNAVVSYTVKVIAK
jgi:predicted secreted protein